MDGRPAHWRALLETERFRAVGNPELPREVPLFEKDDGQMSRLCDLL